MHKNKVSNSIPVEPQTNSDTSTNNTTEKENIKMEVSTSDKPNTRIRHTTPLPIRFCVGDFIEGTKLVSIFNGTKVERALIVNPTTGKVTDYTDTPAVKGMARSMLKSGEDNCQIVLAMPEEWYITANDGILYTLAFTASRMVTAVTITPVETKSNPDVAESNTEVSTEPQTL